jgi:hypothetical protein
MASTRWQVRELSCHISYLLMTQTCTSCCWAWFPQLSTSQCHPPILVLVLLNISFSGPCIFHPNYMRLISLSTAPHDIFCAIYVQPISISFAQGRVFKTIMQVHTICTRGDKEILTHVVILSWDVAPCSVNSYQSSTRVCSI